MESVSITLTGEDVSLLLWATRPSAFVSEPEKLRKQYKDLQKKIAAVIA